MRRSLVSGCRPRYRSRLAPWSSRRNTKRPRRSFDVGPAVELDDGAQRVGVTLHVGHRDELLVGEHRPDLVLDGREGGFRGGDRLHERQVQRVVDHAVLRFELHDDGQVIGMVVRPRLQLGEAVHEGEARRLVVDLLDVEDLEAGLLHHGVDGLQSQQLDGDGRTVAAAVGVFEEVELEGAQAQVELLGERRVRVLDGGGEGGHSRSPSCAGARAGRRSPLPGPRRPARGCAPARWPRAAPARPPAGPATARSYGRSSGCPGGTGGGPPATSSRCRTGRGPGGRPRR